MMVVYGRIIANREKINKFGKLGFVGHWELLINPTEEVIEEANYKKHNKFRQLNVDPNITIKELKKNLSSHYGILEENVDILYCK